MVFGQCVCEKSLEIKVLNYDCGANQKNYGRGFITILDTARNCIHVTAITVAMLFQRVQKL